MSDRLEDVLRREDRSIERGALVLGEVAIELVVELKSPDLRQIVTFGVEEEVVEQRLRGLERGRIAGAQPAIDLHDRVFGGLHLLGQERVAQVRADVQAVDEEDFELFDARLAQLLQLRFGDLLVDLEDDFSGLLVDDVVRGDLAHELLEIDRQAIDLGVTELLDRGLGELGVLLDDRLAADLDVAGRALATEQVELDALRVLAGLLEVDLLRIVEVVEEVLRRVAERAQEHRRVHLPAPVDADEHDVFGVELEVEPRAAVRDDTGAVEHLAARVRLALVVIEEHARASVKLADDHTLGAVDDERPGVRHQRDLAEVDLLLLDVAHDALATLAGVVDHELRRHLDGRGVGHAALTALFDVVFRLLEVVADEDELARPVEVLDREDAPEDGLKADLRPVVLRDVGLQELVVRRLLDVDEVRNLDYFPDTTEMLADAEVGLDDVRHRCS